MAYRKLISVGLRLGCLLICWPVILQAADTKPADAKVADTKDNADKADPYLRVARDEKGQPTALEAAIVRFAPADRSKTAPTVDLVAAVHVAEPSFFDQLNKEFKGYDAVLYELIAPEGAKPPKDGAAASGNPVSAVQNAMTQMLELEFQLKGIDYSAKNFVHADLSPDEFRRSMRDRDESVASIFLRMMGYAMAQEGKQSGGTSDADLLMALFDKNRALALKRVMAEQFEQLGGMLEVLDGPKGSTLISDRNKRALDVLRQQIDGGKKKFAIFYGAGHMPDMEKRLHDDFGLARVETRWLKAWDLVGKR
jgi:hypothetical protein